MASIHRLQGIEMNWEELIKIHAMICGTLTKSILYKATKSQQNIRSALLQRDRAYII